MQNSGLKENLTKLHITAIEQSKSDSEQFVNLKKHHPDFFKVIINYLNSNTMVQPHGLEESVVIQRLVYDFLHLMMSKNQEFKIQLETEFNLLKLLDLKSLKIKEIIEKKINSVYIANSEIYVEMINKYLILVKEIIGKDVEMMNKVKVYCYNLYSLIILIIEHRTTNDFVKNFEENALAIFNQLKHVVYKQKNSSDEVNGDVGCNESDESYYDEEEEEDDDYN